MHWRNLFFVLGLSFGVVALPVAIMHGIASSADKMDTFADWLRTDFQVDVVNLEIGNGEEDSITLPMLDQVSRLCDVINTTSLLQHGFDFIGMSQGGLLARAYVEMCNQPPVRHLITMVSPHGGVFLNFPPAGMYLPKVQASLSFANYWRDPDNLLGYSLFCDFLPRINNEIHTESSSQHLINLLQLGVFQMIWSPVDGVLKPAESAKFSFLNREGIVPLNATELYQNDYLGLRFLDETGRLKINETTCSHVEHRDPVCFAQLKPILAPLLTA
jgi:palmitoyl-protein thioesterase